MGDAPTLSTRRPGCTAEWLFPDVLRRSEIMQVPKAMWGNTGMVRGGLRQPYRSVLNLASYKPPSLHCGTSDGDWASNQWLPKSLLCKFSYHFYLRSFDDLVLCTLRSNSKTSDYALLTLMGRSIQSTNISESWDRGRGKQWYKGRRSLSH